MKGFAVVTALAVVALGDLSDPTTPQAPDAAPTGGSGGNVSDAPAPQAPEVAPIANSSGNPSARAPLLRGGAAARPQPPVAIGSAPAPAPEAAPAAGLAAQVAAAASAPVSVFFWNVHWQCSNAARGSSGACKALATQRFRELAQGVDIAAAIELSHGMSQPVELIPGWAQVNGPCARGNGGDSAALAFGPSWRVQASGGGCLRGDWDTRAFAVARVAPPVPVQGCPSLCVVAIHAPHTWISRGHDTVAEVCGAAAERCAIAMGDWNARARGVGRLWASLIGGAAPALVFPNQRTCCWPETQHFGYFDHVATNIAGASAAGSTVHPYQITGERPWEQHRPVAATIMLPAAR